MPSLLENEDFTSSMHSAMLKITIYVHVYTITDCISSQKGEGMLFTYGIVNILWDSLI